jgi:hypothetical protein
LDLGESLEELKETGPFYTYNLLGKQGSKSKAAYVGGREA